MRRKEDLPLEKVTLLLFEGDLDFFKAMYPRLGASRAIRHLVRKFRLEIEAKVRTDSLEHVEDIDLP